MRRRGLEVFEIELGLREFLTAWTQGPVMLQTLKALVPFVPDAVVNKSIFDNVLAGFADSNAK